MKPVDVEWRKTGDLVRARGRDCVSEYAKRRSKGSNWEIYVISFPVDWLRSGFANGYDPDQHNRFKKLEPGALSHRTDEGTKNGRPFDGACRQAATVACYLYEAWRVENKKRGINDYGCRMEMRDFAARAVAEDFFAWMFSTPKFAWRLEPARDAESFIERVRVLMNKPKSRRDLSVDWILDELDILASDDGLVTKLPPQVSRK
jgi:hypothetical protein